jgi:hypothetical protein
VERPVGGLRVVGTIRVDLVSLGQGTLGENHPKRVQLRVEPLDALQVGLDQLTGGHFARPHHLGLAGGAGEGQVRGVHGVEAICPVRS